MAKHLKGYACLPLCLLLALLCGCEKSVSRTRFLLDTVVTLTADCDEETLSGAFLLCEKYDKLFNAHDEKSEISKLNESGEAELSPDTAKLIGDAAGYCDMTGGRLDITVYPLTALWNFKNGVVPSRDEIARALENVDYHSISVTGDRVNTGGKKIDAGAVAKGFISDKLLAFFKENGVKSGIINLGGNVCVFGEGEYTVAIQKPFSENENAAVMKLSNTTLSTSGVYQRYFEADGVLYHHIIDPATGCPAKSDLLSVTVICECSAKADAFSTACIVMGKEGAAAFIEAQPGVEAVFIDGDQKVSYTSGVKKSGDFLILEK